MSSGPKPIELIQARGLMANLSVAAFLVDREGNLIFYNDAAGKLLGLSFDQAGPMAQAEWGKHFRPRDTDGNEVPVEELPLTIALRRGRPGHARLTITAMDGETHEIEVSAMPIEGSDGQRGAFAIFWPPAD